MTVFRLLPKQLRYPPRRAALTFALGVAIVIHTSCDLAVADAAGSDGVTEVSSFLDFVPTRAGFPAQLDSVTKPITTALNFIRRDASNASVTASAPVAISRESKAQLLTAIERADAIRDSTPRGLRDELLLLEGYAFELLGEPAKAISAYDESLKLRALNPVVMFRRGMALKLANDCAKAIPQFDEVRWASDKLAHEVMYAEAQCQLLIGRGDLAVSLLEQARKKKPDFTLASKMLLDMRMKAFDASPRSIDSTVAAKMTAELTALAVDHPNDEHASLMLAKLLVKKSDPLVALDDLLRGEKLAAKLAEKSEFRDEQSVRLMYDAQVKRGDIGAAERTVSRGLQMNPTSKPLLDAAKQLQVYKDSGL